MGIHIAAGGGKLKIYNRTILNGCVSELGGTTAFTVVLAYLAYIEEYREQPSTIALAKILGITRQTVSKALNDLEELGYNIREIGGRRLEKRN